MITGVSGSGERCWDFAELNTILLHLQLGRYGYGGGNIDENWEIWIQAGGAGLCQRRYIHLIRQGWGAGTKSDG